ncbi:Protein UBASH3A-like protein [Diplonema papillatum]|nr:Protein UBASH3A-like protein [Diplonema papillatum]
MPKKRGARSRPAKRQDDVDPTDGTASSADLPLARWLWALWTNLWEFLRHYVRVLTGAVAPAGDCKEPEAGADGTDADSQPAAAADGELCAGASPPGQGALPFKYTKGKASVCHLVRHGEREDHVNAGWKGKNRDDPPLSQMGRSQAKLTAWYLCNAKTMSAERCNFAKATAVVCSPFLRTLQTADEIASKLDVPMCIEPGLSEFISKKSFQNTPKLPQPSPDAFPRVNNAYVPVRAALPSYPEKESAASARFCETVERIVDANPSAVIVFVTHRFGITACIETFLARLRSASQKQPSYCSVTTLERKAPPRLSPDRTKTWAYHVVASNEHLNESSSVYFK